MDEMGDNGGFDMITVVRDRVTKIPGHLPSKTTDSAEAMVDRYVASVARRFGLPKAITTDEDQSTRASSGQSSANTSQFDAIVDCFPPPMPPDARFWGEKVAQLCVHQPREDLSDFGVPRSGSRAAVFLSIIHLVFELGEEAAASRNG